MTYQDLFTIAYKDIQRRFRQKLKPLVFIFEQEGACGYETSERIEVNISQFVTTQGKTPSLERVVITAVALLAHEIVGHAQEPIEPPAKLVLKQIFRYPEEDRRGENLPYHFQYAILGDRECIEKLRKAGYGNLLLGFLHTCKDTLVQLKRIQYRQHQDMRKKRKQ
jgi:hypothetical protein